MEAKKYNLINFLTPSFVETGIMLYEGVVSVPAACITAAFTSNPWIIAAGALSPQAITYAGFRAYELFGKDEEFKKVIRITKEIPSKINEKLNIETIIK